MKETKNTDLLPGYIRFRTNIKKTTRDKFWSLKKKLGKSFGQLLTQWINEKYIENFEKEEKKI